MKNKAKRASALVLLLLPLFCGYVTTMGFPGRLNTWNIRSLQNGRRVTPKDEATSDGLPNGRFLLKGQRRTLADLDVVKNADVEEEKECSLTDEVLAQITKPSASEWLVDDQTVQLLNNNLQQLIRCTRPLDKIVFSTQEVINVTETIKIIHELEFLRTPQTTSDAETSDTITTVFRCPKSAPVFLVKTSNFTAVGVTIANCKESSGRGTIIVRPQSAASLKHVRIEDNNITGVYVNKHANLTLHEAYFTKNKVVGNGPAIHSKSNAYITITDSTFKGNIAKDGHGGSIYVGSSNTVFIYGSTFTENHATHSGGGLYLYAENILNVFGSKLVENDSIEGGGIFLWANNTAVIHSVIVSNNTASVRGGMFASKGNNLTTDGSPLSNDDVDYNGGGIGLYKYNNVFMRECLLSNNHAGNEGGAINLGFYNKITMRGCKLEYNDAMNGGGMSGDEYNTFALTDCNFTSNIAEEKGGALRLSYKGIAIMRECQLYFNSAWNGGALYAGRKNEATIIDSILYSNIAQLSGAAINLYWANIVIMRDCQFLFNTAWNGGALFTSRKNVATIIDSILYNNHAQRDGGAIYLYWANILFVRNCRLSINVAWLGGALYAYAYNNGTIVDSVVLDNRETWHQTYRGLCIGLTANSLTLSNVTIEKYNARVAEANNPHSAMDAAI